MLHKAHKAFLFYFIDYVLIYNLLNKRQRNKVKTFSDRECGYSTLQEMLKEILRQREMT